MALRYLSKEWLAQGRKLAEASTEFAAAAKGLTASLLSVVTDGPRGKTTYMYYRFTDGKINELVVGTDEAMAKKPAEFKAIGTYETYSLINQGKLSSTQAVFQRKIKIEGDLGKALRYVKPLEVFNGILRTVPAEY